MYKVGIWIDVVRCIENQRDTVCALFSSMDMLMRPCVGESLIFHQAKGIPLEFKLASPIGLLRQSIVAVTVEDVRHDIIGGNDGIQFSTTLKCTDIPVASDDDARAVIAIMTTKLGFELDPYGVNLLKV